MCGITGYIDYQNSITEKDLINSSIALRHRGGSGNGHILEHHAHYSIGLANERLATIDISSESIQPFTSTCGNYTITFNGTIYNYLDLRLSLINHGIVFRTLSDTEVLIECYKKWGHELFRKIDGAFAFAIFDRKLNQLFLARDTMGVKPLYYYADKNFFAFSSEIKGLLKFPIQKNINSRALQKYMRHGYFFGDETLFEHISNFKKKNHLIIDLNSGNHLEREFSNHEKNEQYPVPDSEEKIVAKLNELITGSVLRRNIADVNVGILLSGGYDSSIVAGIIQKNHTKKIKTFTLGFKDKRLNEAPQARTIANYLNTNHHEYYIDDNGAIETLESLPNIFDEPMGDSGAIPLAFIINQVAKEDIKVLLGAEGGDELFAGYRDYKLAIRLNKYAPKIPNAIRSFLFSIAKNRKNKLDEIFKSTSLLGTYEIISSFFSHNETAKLLTNEINKKAITVVEGNSVKSLLEYDLANYLTNDLLLKSDRIAMYHGIDNRDALLSTDLVNFVGQLDETLFLKNGELKYLLKKVAHQYIPKELLDRPKKGFSIPLAKWLQTIFKSHVDKYLSTQELEKHNLFNTSEVFKIKNDFYMNGNLANAKKIWLLLQFQMWYSTHID